jgi:PleD family two-component response regulator
MASADTYLNWSSASLQCAWRVNTVEPVNPRISRSLLVVDDDPPIQCRLAALLESAGYSVAGVSSVREAHRQGVWL